MSEKRGSTRGPSRRLGPRDDPSRTDTADSTSRHRIRVDREAVGRIRVGLWSWRVAVRLSVLGALIHHPWGNVSVETSCGLGGCFGIHSASEASDNLVKLILVMERVTVTGSPSSGEEGLQV